MEDKLAVGMYVRLNCNYALGIGKTISEIDEDNFIKTKFKDGFECSLPTYMIKKASRNIVDLIEKNDFVNGHRVIQVDRESLELDIENSMYGCGCETIDGNKDIKSIVTKEAFENISYEVDE